MPEIAKEVVVAAVEVKRPIVADPRFALAAKRFVELAVVANEFVDVEFPKVARTKVESTVVDVALIAATTGVEVETRFPLPSVDTSMFVPIPERRKFVATKFVANKFVEVAFEDVLFPTVRLPRFAKVEKRFVELAVEANEFVDVAFPRIERSAGKT